MKKVFLIIFLMVFFALVGCQKTDEVEVMFKTVGGTTIEAITSLDDLLEGIPETTKEGYTFIGWYLDQEYTEPFDILEDRESWKFTLYAKWEANDQDYQVEHYLEALDGTYTLTDTDDLSGVTDQEVTATPKTYTGFSVNDEHELTVPTLVLPATGSAVLKLYYSRNVYQITIDEAGGDAVADITLKYGEAIVLPTLTRFGHIFDGWSTYPETMPAEPITVVASWIELPQFTVSFDENGGSDVNDQMIYQGYLATEPTPPEKVGYAFMGWYLGEATTPFAFTTPITEAIELTAKFNPIEVDVTVEYYTEKLDGTYELNQSVIVKALTESVYTAQALTINGFTEDQTHVLRMPSGTVVGDGSLRLKLYYSRNTYTIQFESNANLSIQSIEELFETPVSKPQDPIRSGYTFVGWYSDQALLNAYTFTTMPFGGITLYAKWQGQPTNLYFNANGGSEVAMLTAPLGDPITAPTNPTKEGYGFVGWFSDIALTEPFTSWVMPAGGLTLYAKWTPNLYTITFEENGGSVVNDLTQGYLTEVIAPLSPTKTDYLFMGWFTDTEFLHAYTFDVMPLGGLTLYAKWISEEEGLNLAYIKTLDHYTSVKVKGMVMMTSSLPYVGFYITDGSANIYVSYDQSLVSEGLSYAFDAILIYEQGIPKLVSVTQLESITHTYSMMTEEVYSVDALHALSFNEQSISVEVEGILLDHEGFVLASSIDGEMIQLSSQFSLDDVNTFLNQMVTLKGVLHRYQQGWILGVYDITLIGLTDLERVDLIKTYIDSQIATTYEGMDSFKFITDDPWGFSSVLMGFGLGDDVFYDSHHQMFTAVTAIEQLDLNIDITVNHVVYPYQKIISVYPRTYHTVLDVLNSDDGLSYNIKGIVVMAHMYENVFVIKDQTGEMFITGDLSLNYGDEVALSLTTYRMDGMLVGEVESDDYIEIISENNVLNNPAVPKTLAEVFAFDLTDETVFGDYIEVRGFIKFEGDMEYHGAFKVMNDFYQLTITPLTYEGYEQIFEFADLEVLIRGYFYLDGTGAPALLFTGQRLDIQIPEYTDLERVEMILTLFSNVYADHTFTSFEVFEMLPYHPILGGHITWTFVEGEDVYDLNKKMFGYVSEPKTIKIELTISQGSASRTYLYQTLLEGPEVLTIDAFKQLDMYEPNYVKGYVVYRNPQMAIIQDETGMLLVDCYDADIYKGDHVILYGFARHDYDYEENIYLAHDRRDELIVPLVVHIIERGLSTPIQSNIMSLSDLINMDPELTSSYNKYVIVSGYLEDDGWSFILSSAGYELIFDAVDEYTMYQLRAEVNKHVSIALWVDEYNGSRWMTTYLGIDGDLVPKEYTLTEKQDMMIDWVESIWGVPLLADDDYYMPSSYTPFNATISYTVLAANQSQIDLNFGYVYPTTEPLTIPLSAWITIDNITIEHVIQVNVIPMTSIGSMTIDEAKSHVGEVVEVDGQIYATYAFDYSSYGLLINDGTDFLIVKATPYNYFYGEYEIGQQGSFTGIMRFEEGRYVFETIEWDMMYNTLPLLAATPIDLETLSTEDHSFDQHLGEFVSVSGRLERYNWGHYELVVGHERIRIQSVYYQESNLYNYIGYDVTLKGFILGPSTYENSDQITLIMGYRNYDGLGNIILDEHDDQVIAEKIADEVIRNRYDEPYYPGESISLTLYHNLFTSLVIDYVALNNSEVLVDGGYTFTVLDTPVDVEITIELTVTYGTGLAVRTFNVYILGFTYNTLDDLFDDTVPFDEIDMSAIVIDSAFDHAYFMIDGDIYYYKGYLGMYEEPGSVVTIHGKKSIIDGLVNYSYNVFVQSMDDYAYLSLTPRVVTLDALYTTDLSVDDLRRDYLTIYGKLGYDAYLDYFYLDHDGYRVYIRHHLSDHEAYGSGLTILGSYGMDRYEMMRLIGEFISINVLFPNDHVLIDYLLVDFIGTLDDISVPDWTPLELVELIKDKVYAYNHGQIYKSGEDLDWLFYDQMHDSMIDYEFVDPLETAINFDQMQAGIVSETRTVEIRATVQVYDSAISDYVSGSIIFSVTIKPVGLSSIYDVLYGRIGHYYHTKGIVQFIYPEYFMIIKDETGSIYVELPGASAGYPVIEVGDEVEVLGMRTNYEYEDYVPVMSQTIDVNVLSTGHAVNLSATHMTVEDIIALDYLDPGVFNQYISFTGVVTFSGNQWYPSFDSREAGYTDNTYDLQLWGDTYDPFNQTMYGLLGQTITVYGYLIGYEYIYQAFDWILYVDTYVVNE